MPIDVTLLTDPGSRFSDGLPGNAIRSDDPEQRDCEILSAVSMLPNLSVWEIFSAMESLLTIAEEERQ